MSSRYEYQTLSSPVSMSSRQSSTSYDYEPLSPPWSTSTGSPPAIHYSRAPAMPYIPLPPCDDHVHPSAFAPHALMTPPASPSRVHPVLCARPTVVRYDLAADPRTLRMSSAAPQPAFPGHDAAATPSAPVIHVQCERTGRVVAVHAHAHARAHDYGHGHAHGGRTITCMDLVVQLHRFFDQPLPADEWRCVRGPQRDAMKAAYAARTGRLYGPSAHMKLVDCLLGATVFKCVLPKQSDASGTTWLLQTTR